MQLAGGRHADIVVLPTASQMCDTGVRYARLFAALGTERITAIDFDTRRDAQERGRLAPGAGTRAGAAFISEYVIAFGDEGPHQVRWFFFADARHTRKRLAAPPLAEAQALPSRLPQYKRTAESKCQLRRISMTSNWRTRFGEKAW